jgi:cytoskeletal protein RodZ
MPVAAEKKKRSLLPLLTVLFVFSYGLMTLLIVVQASAIEQQRTLIKALMVDSAQLWAQRGRAISENQFAKTQQQAGQAAHAPSKNAPSPQTPQAQNRAGKVSKPQVEVPPVPASDFSDQRRNLHTI